MIWLTNGDIYNVHLGCFTRGTLVIADGRIVETTQSTVPPDDALVIDLRGRYLLPGLIDCHVHLTVPSDEPDPHALARRSDALAALYTAKAAERTLLAGVTTVRDVGGWNHVEMAVRKAARAGDFPAPRMFLAGKLLSITTGSADYYPGMYEVCDGVDAVTRGARRQIAQGANLIKVMATGAMLSPEDEDAGAVHFTRAEIAAAVQVARDHKLHVAAHAHADEGIRNAVEAGVASIEHGSFASDETLHLMAKRGTYLVPTLCVTPAMMRDQTVAGALAAHLRQRLLEFDEQHVDAIRRAHALGVPIAMGTDAGTPGNHHGDNVQEVVELVTRARLSPVEALLCATMNPARLLGKHTELGSIDRDKRADIIAVRRNPLDDIRALTDVDFVMKDGVVYRHR